MAIETALITPLLAYVASCLGAVVLAGFGRAAAEDEERQRVAHSPECTDPGGAKQRTFARHPPGWRCRDPPELPLRAVG